MESLSKLFFTLCGRLIKTFPMPCHRPFVILAFAISLFTARAVFAETPRLLGVGEAMREMAAQKEIAGAVTMVVSKDKLLHLESTGFADVAAPKPMTPDTLFWIASMTKPITGVAILMLQDAGKLRVTDRVEKFLPEFAELKTPSGQPAHLTITQIIGGTAINPLTNLLSMVCKGPSGPCAQQDDR
jgi:CubicO group peptidase (beta-lactamase class C family)